MTSKSLCLAGSFSYLKSILLRIPCSLTSISFLLKISANLRSSLELTFSSTKTIALLRLPPFISPCSNRDFTSCKNTNVLASEISLLKSDKLLS